jgi:hypothetical protein
VVGDQVLRLADRGDELADPLVAAGEGAQQPPPDWVGDQPERGREVISCHARMVRQHSLMDSGGQRQAKLV